MTQVMPWTLNQLHYELFPQHSKTKILAVLKCKMNVCYIRRKEIYYCLSYNDILTLNKLLKETK